MFLSAPIEGPISSNVVDPDIMWRAEHFRTQPVGRQPSDLKWKSRLTGRATPNFVAPLGCEGDRVGGLRGLASMYLYCSVYADSQMCVFLIC